MYVRTGPAIGLNPLANESKVAADGRASNGGGACVQEVTKFDRRTYNRVTIWKGEGYLFSVVTGRALAAKRYMSPR